MRRFLSLFEGSILDVGGTATTWSECSRQVTILNLKEPGEGEPRPERFVVGDARALPFADSTFDVVYSNSVIEHLGTFDNQSELAREVRRVGKSYWVQTPARCFPVEPHYLTPFVHWLPARLRRRVLPYTIWARIAHPPSSYMDRRIAEVRLVSRRELARLFPDAVIERERFLGLTKSWLAIRRAASTVAP